VISRGGGDVQPDHETVHVVPSLHLCSACSPDSRRRCSWRASFAYGSGSRAA
jgi:hypothetical protein